MKDTVIKIAKEHLADIVGFAPASRFGADDPIFKIFPQTKTVICLAFRVLRGIYRGTEEGTTYYQYTTMAVENMEETVMPMAQLRVANYIEAQGYIALPQRRHQQIMKEKDSVNPEVDYTAIYRGVEKETQMNFEDAAIKCGIGEKGFSGNVLTDEFGPMVRYTFILTDAEFEATPIQTPHLCDKCKKCVKACHGGAISEEGKVDPWQCAVYYNGANGLKNPFMPPDAYAEFEDRIKIIAGEAKVTPEKARKIIDATIFYPPAQHSYTASICGRACDTACYMHLEEQGKLTKKFNRPFRTREEWKFKIDDFK
jgi:ferredoxin